MTISKDEHTRLLVHMQSRSSLSILWLVLLYFCSEGRLEGITTVMRYTRGRGKCINVFFDCNLNFVFTAAFTVSERPLVVSIGLHRTIMLGSGMKVATLAQRTYACC